ncbi:hypothetical protein T12_2577 [Trichinella patagoniensis]|uniref:Uncharacterized protein n=1 Tax=Trichinella patagoniensis TaxID=990121 RepID=A0A0V1ACU5_9BILA|nr:hypothetical protein T12_2577 [Trichinella patagoniensis]
MDSTKNVAYDAFYRLRFVKFMKQITDFNAARYYAHFEIKLRSLVIFLGSNTTTRQIELQILT